MTRILIRRSSGSPLAVGYEAEPFGSSLTAAWSGMRRDFRVRLGKHDSVWEMNKDDLPMLRPGGLNQTCISFELAELSRSGCGQNQHKGISASSNTYLNLIVIPIGAAVLCSATSGRSKLLDR